MSHLPAARQCTARPHRQASASPTRADATEWGEGDTECSVAPPSAAASCSSSSAPRTKTNRPRRRPAGTDETTNVSARTRRAVQEDRQTQQQLQAEAPTMTAPSSAAPSPPPAPPLTSFPSTNTPQRRSTPSTASAASGSYHGRRDGSFRRSETATSASLTRAVPQREQRAGTPQAIRQSSTDAGKSSSPSSSLHTNARVSGPLKRKAATGMNSSTTTGTSAAPTAAAAAATTTQTLGRNVHQITPPEKQRANDVHAARIRGSHSSNSSNNGNKRERDASERRSSPVDTRAKPTTGTSSCTSSPTPSVTTTATTATTTTATTAAGGGGAAATSTPAATPRLFSPPLTPVRTSAAVEAFLLGVQNCLYRQTLLLQRVDERVAQLQQPISVPSSVLRRSQRPSLEVQQHVSPPPQRRPSTTVASSTPPTVAAATLLVLRSRGAASSADEIALGSTGFSLLSTAAASPATQEDLPVPLPPSKTSDDPALFEANLHATATTTGDVFVRDTALMVVATAATTTSASPSSVSTSDPSPLCHYSWTAGPHSDHRRDTHRSPDRVSFAYEGATAQPATATAAAAARGGEASAPSSPAQPAAASPLSPDTSSSLSPSICATVVVVHPSLDRTSDAPPLRPALQLSNNTEAEETEETEETQKTEQPGKRRGTRTSVSPARAGGERSDEKHDPKRRMRRGECAEEIADEEQAFLAGFSPLSHGPHVEGSPSPVLHRTPPLPPHLQVLPPPTTFSAPSWSPSHSGSLGGMCDAAASTTALTPRPGAAGAGGTTHATSGAPAAVPRLSGSVAVSLATSMDSVTLSPLSRPMSVWGESPMAHSISSRPISPGQLHGPTYLSTGLSTNTGFSPGNARSLPLYTANGSPAQRSMPKSGSSAHTPQQPPHGSTGAMKAPRGSRTGALDADTYSPTFFSLVSPPGTVTRLANVSEGGATAAIPANAGSGGHPRPPPPTTNAVSSSSSSMLSSRTVTAVLPALALQAALPQAGVSSQPPGMDLVSPVSAPSPASPASPASTSLTVSRCMSGGAATAATRGRLAPRSGLDAEDRRPLDPAPRGLHWPSTNSLDDDVSLSAEIQHSTASDAPYHGDATNERLPFARLATLLLSNDSPTARTLSQGKGASTTAAGMPSTTNGVACMNASVLSAVSGNSSSSSSVSNSIAVGGAATAPAAGAGGVNADGDSSNPLSESHNLTCRQLTLSPSQSVERLDALEGEECTAYEGGIKQNTQAPDTRTAIESFTKDHKTVDDGSIEDNTDETSETSPRSLFPQFAVPPPPSSLSELLRQRQEEQHQRQQRRPTNGPPVRTMRRPPMAPTRPSTVPQSGVPVLDAAEEVQQSREATEPTADWLSFERKHEALHLPAIWRDSEVIVVGPVEEEARERKEEVDAQWRLAAVERRRTRQPAPLSEEGLLAPEKDRDDPREADPASGASARATAATATTRTEIEDDAEEEKMWRLLETRGSRRRGHRRNSYPGERSPHTTPPHAPRHAATEEEGQRGEEAGEKEANRHCRTDRGPADDVGPPKTIEGASPATHADTMAEPATTHLSTEEAGDQNRLSDSSAEPTQPRVFSRRHSVPSVGADNDMFVTGEREDRRHGSNIDNTGAACANPADWRLLRARYDELLTFQHRARSADHHHHHAHPSNTGTYAVPPDGTTQASLEPDSTEAMSAGIYGSGARSRSHRSRSRYTPPPPPPEHNESYIASMSAVEVTHAVSGEDEGEEPGRATGALLPEVHLVEVATAVDANAPSDSAVVPSPPPDGSEDERKAKKRSTSRKGDEAATMMPSSEFSETAGGGDGPETEEDECQQIVPPVVPGDARVPAPVTFDTALSTDGGESHHQGSNSATPSTTVTPDRPSRQQTGNSTSGLFPTTVHKEPPPFLAGLPAPVTVSASHNPHTHAHHPTLVEAATASAPTTTTATTQELPPPPALAERHVTLPRTIHCTEQEEEGHGSEEESEEAPEHVICCHTSDSLSEEEVEDERDTPPSTRRAVRHARTPVTTRHTPRLALTPKLRFPRASPPASTGRKRLGRPSRRGAVAHRAPASLNKPQLEALTLPSRGVMRSAEDAVLETQSRYHSAVAAAATAPPTQARSAQANRLPSLSSDAAAAAVVASVTRPRRTSADGTRRHSSMSKHNRGTAMTATSAHRTREAAVAAVGVAGAAASSKQKAPERSSETPPPPPPHRRASAPLTSSLSVTPPRATEPPRTTSPGKASSFARFQPTVVPLPVRELSTSALDGGELVEPLAAATGAAAPTSSRVSSSSHSPLCSPRSALAKQACTTAAAVSRAVELSPRFPSAAAAGAAAAAAAAGTSVTASSTEDRASNTSNAPSSVGGVAGTAHVSRDPAAATAIRKKGRRTSATAGTAAGSDGDGAAVRPAARVASPQKTMRSKDSSKNGRNTAERARERGGGEGMEGKGAVVAAAAPLRRKSLTRLLPSAMAEQDPRRRHSNAHVAAPPPPSAHLAVASSSSSGIPVLDNGNATLPLEGAGTLAITPTSRTLLRRLAQQKERTRAMEERLRFSNGSNHPANVSDVSSGRNTSTPPAELVRVDSGAGSASRARTSIRSAIGTTSAVPKSARTTDFTRQQSAPQTVGRPTRHTEHSFELHVDVTGGATPTPAKPLPALPSQEEGQPQDETAQNAGRALEGVERHVSVIEPAAVRGNTGERGLRRSGGNAETRDGGQGGDGTVTPIRASSVGKISNTALTRRRRAEVRGRPTSTHAVAATPSTNAATSAATHASSSLSFHAAGAATAIASGGASNTAATAASAAGNTANTFRRGDSQRTVQRASSPSAASIHITEADHRRHTIGGAVAAIDQGERRLRPTRISLSGRQRV